VAGPQLAQSVRGGFLEVNTDAEPTSFAPSRRPPISTGFAAPEDDAPTSLRPQSPVPPERPRRPSTAPVAAGRRGTLPPVASPSPSPVPRTPVGLGVSEPAPRLDPRFDSRMEPLRPPGPRAETGQTPTEPTPAPGSVPLVEWNGSPTVTPRPATPYARSGSDFKLVSSAVRTPERRRRKLLFVAGLMLVVAMLVLALALAWPDGPQRGSIEVLSVPAGATVRIDGTVLSKLTPLRISDVELRQPHRIAVSMRGFDTWENEARFDTGERDIRLQAVLVPAVGTLEVVTIPGGAEAIVNGRISGTTPTKVGDLPPNEEITLELRLRGYKVVYKTLQWGGKRSLAVNVPLEKAQ
jgi:hypothetical protein